MLVDKYKSIQGPLCNAEISNEVGREYIQRLDIISKEVYKIEHPVIRCSIWFVILTKV
jgi:hypothetical protein